MVASVEALTFSSAEVCAQAGCSYRQLDYWARIGLCESSAAFCNGSGTQRRWTDRDVAVVKVLTSLTRLVPNGRFHKLREMVAVLVQSPTDCWVVLTPSGWVSVVHPEDLPAALDAEGAALCVRVP